MEFFRLPTNRLVELGSQLQCQLSPAADISNGTDGQELR